MGVILSGMGSDGSLGLQAIKEKGGGTFAQEPASAKCDGMPKSAIAAGLVDFVAPAEELPTESLAIFNTRRWSLNPGLPKRTKPGAASKKSLFFYAIKPGTTSPYIRTSLCTDGSNGEWVSIRLTRSRPISGFFKRTRKKWACCSRSF